jgi:alpha-1,6-mannosyltransferase
VRKLFKNIHVLTQSIVSRRGTMLFAFSVYVCGFAAYSMLPPMRTASTSLFLVMYSIHALWGLFCLACISAQYDSFVPYTFVENDRKGAEARRRKRKENAQFVVRKIIVQWLHSAPLRHCGQNQKEKVHKNSFLLIFCIILLPRLLVSPMFPWLSDDAFRYLWDGHILLHGMNPYLVPPFASEAALVRSSEIELYGLLDYTNVTSIYPPLAEYTFAACVWLGKWFSPSWKAGFFVWKALLCASELIGVWMMYLSIKHLRIKHLRIKHLRIKHLRIKHLRRSWMPLWVYACMPLPVLEIAGQAHLDGLLCAPLGVVVFVLARRVNVNLDLAQTEVSALPPKKSHVMQNRLESLVLGSLCALLGAIKILPAIIPKERFYAVVGFAVTLFVLCVPLLHDVATVRHFADLARHNALYWQFNGAPYYALCYVAAWLHLPEYWLRMPLVFSFLRTFVVLGTVFFAKARRIRTLTMDIFTALALPLSVIMLFSPKVHTWYCVPLLLLNICIGWKWLPVLASGFVLSYAYYVAVPPQEQYALEMVVWGIGFICLCAEWLHVRKQAYL